MPHASVTSASKGSQVGTLVVVQRAYNDVFFGGNATQVQRQIVLADLARYTNYFHADDIALSNEEIRERNAMKKVFARIIRFGFSDNADLSGLFQAVIQDRSNPSIKDI